LGNLNFKKSLQICTLCISLYLSSQEAGMTVTATISRLSTVLAGLHNSETAVCTVRQDARELSALESFQTGSGVESSLL
jgi:hypothetical protein